MISMTGREMIQPHCGEEAVQLLASRRKELLADKSLPRESTSESAKPDFLWMEIFYNAFTHVPNKCLLNSCLC